MNITILAGNLTRDIELKYTPKGTPVADISIAVNRVSFTDAGEKREEVLFQECRAWGKAAESLASHFHKGKPILINGRLAQEQWEDKESGKKRSKTLVIIEHWEFHGGDRTARAEAPGGAYSSPPPQGSTQHRSTRPTTYKATQEPQDIDPTTTAIEGDDIPF